MVEETVARRAEYVEERVLVTGPAPFVAYFDAVVRKGDTLRRGLRGGVFFVEIVRRGRVRPVEWRRETP